MSSQSLDEEIVQLVDAHRSIAVNPDGGQRQRSGDDRLGRRSMDRKKEGAPSTYYHGETMIYQSDQGKRMDFFIKASTQPID